MSATPAEMDDHYTPKSDFVALASGGHIPLSGTNEAESNLRRLIGFTQDPDKSNRDWATMALGMYGPDTDETREAPIAAADDKDSDVRGEAIEALARRDLKLALPLVKRDLQRVPCGYGVFIAAGLVADPSLVELLNSFDFDSDAPWIDENVRDAIRACETQNPIEAWQF